MSSASPSPPQLPRFSWPVRILITLILFHMLFRSFGVLYPWTEWLEELTIERMPKGLPTRGDIARLRDKAGGSNELVWAEFKSCFASLGRYWNPTPKDETLELLNAEHIHWCDLRVHALTAQRREEFNLPEGIGFMVTRVLEESNAANKGVKAGDVITKINGQDATGALPDLRNASQISIELTILRGGRPETIAFLATPSGPWQSRWENAALWIQYGIAWLQSRLQWCEAILNIDQEWPMFSPNVGRKKYPARARLLYDDGTEKTIHQRSDPEDLTWYIRWGPGKYLGYDRAVSDDSGSRWYACPGWCNFLSHQYPVNERGAKLKEIRLYQVRYDFPPPGEDARAFLKKQMEATRDHRQVSEQVYTTFFRYWVNTKQYEFVRCHRTSFGLTPLE